MRLPLAFPADTVFGTEDEVDEAIGSGTVHVDCVQDADQPTPAEPSEEPEPTEQPEPADPSEGGTAEEPGADGGRETALQALRRIAREDLATVGGDLVDHWVPQLSSKYFGLRAEGRRWTYQAILAETSSNAVEVYITAAENKLEALAVASSAYLLSFDLTTVTDDMAVRMGARYFRRLIALQAGRVDRLKVLLTRLPRAQPDHEESCSFAAHGYLEAGWVLTVASLVPELRAGERSSLPRARV